MGGNSSSSRWVVRGRSPSIWRLRCPKPQRNLPQVSNDLIQIGGLIRIGVADARARLAVLRDGMAGIAQACGGGIDIGRSRQHELPLEQLGVMCFGDTCAGGPGVGG